MGKAKILAKYRLVGKGTVTAFIFFMTFILTFVLGNFSFIISEIMNFAGVFFDTDIAESAATVALSVLGILLFILICFPFRLGCERWFLLNAKGEKTGIKELFHYFTPLGIIKSISAFLFCFLKKSAAALLFLFPSGCLFSVLYFSLKEGEISLKISYALFTFALLLFLTGFVFYFYYSSRYFAFYDIIISNEKIKPQSAYEKSLEITKGAYLKICLFRLSFLPWILPCLLILPAFYVWGYYREAKTMLCLRNDLLR